MIMAMIRARIKVIIQVIKIRMMMIRAIAMMMIIKVITTLIIICKLITVIAMAVKVITTIIMRKLKRFNKVTMIITEKNKQSH